MMNSDGLLIIVWDQEMVMTKGRRLTDNSSSSELLEISMIINSDYDI